MRGWVLQKMNWPWSAKPEPIHKAGTSASLTDRAGDARARGLESEKDVASTRPRKSFARGVAVGIAIMIPIWVWIALTLLR